MVPLTLKYAADTDKRVIKDLNLYAATAIYIRRFFSFSANKQRGFRRLDAEHLYGNSPQLPMIGQPVGMFLFPQYSDWSVGGLCSLTVCSVPGYCQSRQLGAGAGPHPGAA